MGSNFRTMYHTQERRWKRLTEPIICERDDAWLGNGYYFWDEMEDAEKWGNDSKRATRKYEIYQATIDCENVIDTVFNEEHYKFWIKQIEKAAKNIVKQTNQKPTLKEINSYLKTKAKWDDKVTGILFQDLPRNKNFSMVVSFYYRKRIQLVAYNLEIVSNFVFNKEEYCT